MSPRQIKSKVLEDARCPDFGKGKCFVSEDINSKQLVGGEM